MSFSIWLRLVSTQSSIVRLIFRACVSITIMLRPNGFFKVISNLKILYLRRLSGALCTQFSGSKSTATIYVFPDKQKIICLVRSSILRVAWRAAQLLPNFCLLFRGVTNKTALVPRLLFQYTDKRHPRRKTESIRPPSASRAIQTNDYFHKEALEIEFFAKLLLQSWMRS